METVVFTPAEDGHLPVILGLMRDYYAYDNLEFNERGAAGALAVLLKDSSLGCVFLIEHQHEPIGYIALT